MNTGQGKGALSSNLRPGSCSTNFRPVDWFYAHNGKQFGPVPVAHFEELIRSGRITPETLVWRMGHANWQPLGSITAPPPPTLSPLLPPPLPDAPRPALTRALTGCAECGREFQESEMIPLNGLWICAKCKPIFVQRLREGAPLTAAGAEAWQSGDAVVTLHDGALPMRCAKCNGAVTGKPIPRTFFWQPEWLYTLFIIPPLCVIVWFFIRKPVVVSVPICEKCRQRRRMFIGVSWLLVAIGIGCYIAGISLTSGILIILPFVIAFLAILLGLRKCMLVYVKRIDPKHVWMRGFCKEYRLSLPEFPENR